MAELQPNVRLNLANTPENVVLVRAMLAGVAHAIDLDENELNDILTAVTEACNNVVLHAYEGQEGPLEVEVDIAQNGVLIVVRDHGTGIQTPTDADEQTTVGIGLHVIEALAQHIQFKSVPSGGTELRMQFAASSTNLPQASLEDGPSISIPTPVGSPPMTTMSIAPIGLAGPILPRLMSALAARAHFSTDRISDTQLLADALVAHAPRAISGNHLSIGVHVEPRDLELRISPLGVGCAQRLIGDSDLEGLGPVIEKLTDRHGVATAGRYEMLTLGLSDRR